MDNTLSDYDLIDRMKKEIQNEIHKLRSENTRLRLTLEIIADTAPQQNLREFAQQALNEVTK